MSSKLQPKVGDKFYSKDLKIYGAFVDFSKSQDKLREQYPRIQIEEFTVDWATVKDRNKYEPEGYNLEDLTFNADKNQWEGV